MVSVDLVAGQSRMGGPAQRQLLIVQAGRGQLHLTTCYRPQLNKLHISKRASIIGWKISGEQKIGIVEVARSKGSESSQARTLDSYRNSVQPRDIHTP